MATTILNHALINHKLTIMRDKNTNNVVFKDNLDEIAMLMAYEVTKDLPLENNHKPAITASKNTPITSNPNHKQNIISFKSLLLTCFIFKINQYQINDLRHHLNQEQYILDHLVFHQAMLIPILHQDDFLQLL